MELQAVKKDTGEIIPSDICLTEANGYHLHHTNPVNSYLAVENEMSHARA